MKHYHSHAFSASTATGTGLRDGKSALVRKVVEEFDHHERKTTADRLGWFDRYTLPRVSVLARLPRHDREAVIAHYRAKELRKVADAMHNRDYYAAGNARKRLERVEAVAKAFTAAKS